MTWNASETVQYLGQNHTFIHIQRYGKTCVPLSDRLDAGNGDLLFGLLLVQRPGGTEGARASIRVPTGPKTVSHCKRVVLVSARTHTYSSLQNTIGSTEHSYVIVIIQSIKKVLSVRLKSCNLSVICSKVHRHRSDILYENICCGRLHACFCMSPQIIDHALLISDQSGYLFPDCL